MGADVGESLEHDTFKQLAKSPLYTPSPLRQSSSRTQSMQSVSKQQAPETSMGTQQMHSSNEQRPVGLEAFLYGGWQPCDANMHSLHTTIASHCPAAHCATTGGPVGLGVGKSVGLGVGATIDATVGLCVGEKNGAKCFTSQTKSYVLVALARRRNLHLHKHPRRPYLRQCTACHFLWHPSSRMARPLAAHT